MDKYLIGSEIRRERSGSLGELEDKIKRKREGKDNLLSEELRAFKRSNQVERSPVKCRKEEDSSMDEILKKLVDIQAELKEIKENGNSLQKNNEELRKELRTYQTKMEEENNALKNKIKVLENKIQGLEEREETRERNSRKNNIIISKRIEENVKNEPELLIKEIQKICKELTGEDESLNKVTYLTKNKSGLDILRAEVRTFESKLKIMKNKHKLSRKEEKIFIEDDFTKEEAKTQKSLRELARRERNKGHKVTVGYRKLNINGKWTKWEELENRE